MAVYFICPVGADGPIKIGFSDKPVDRLRSLSVSCPFPLEIAATIDGGPQEECQFHALFAEHRSHGEWFRPHEQVRAVIEQIKAGTFDFSILPARTAPSIPRASDVNQRCKIEFTDDAPPPLAGLTAHIRVLEIGQALRATDVDLHIARTTAGRVARKARPRKKFEVWKDGECIYIKRKPDPQQV